MQELSVNRLPNLMMGQAIEQRGRHLGITEGARPFTEGEVCGDEPAEEQELATGLSEGQMAEFIESDEIHPGLAPPPAKPPKNYLFQFVPK